MFRLNDEEDDDGFAIVPDRSHVFAVIRDIQPEEVTWIIMIDWHSPKMEEHSFRDANIEISDVSFGPGDCRRLEGREARIAFKYEDVHPVLPDNPANFYYCGDHTVPDQNHIRIASCNGPDLEIQWRCVVEGTPLEIRETVTFRKLVVSFTKPGKPSLDDAWKIALVHLDKEHLGEPTVHSSYVEFPVRYR